MYIIILLKASITLSKCMKYYVHIKFHIRIGFSLGNILIL